MSKIKTNRITEIKSNLVEELVSDGCKEIMACMQCGMCTGGCPSGRRNALRTRKIIREAQLGLEEVLTDEDIWFCSTCYTCLERCPRKVPTTDIILKLRNLAVKEGHIHPSHRALSHTVFKTGHGVPIDDEKWSRAREFYGLPPLPATVHSDPEALEEIQTLLRCAEFDKLVGIEPVEPIVPEIEVKVPIKATESTAKAASTETPTVE